MPFIILVAVQWIDKSYKSMDMWQRHFDLLVLCPQTGGHTSYFRKILNNNTKGFQIVSH